MQVQMQFYYFLVMLLEFAYCNRLNIRLTVVQAELLKNATFHSPLLYMNIKCLTYDVRFGAEFYSCWNWVEIHRSN